MSQSQWAGLENDELALIVASLPDESDLWKSAVEELERRKGH